MLYNKVPTDLKFVERGEGSFKILERASYLRKEYRGERGLP